MRRAAAIKASSSAPEAEKDPFNMIKTPLKKVTLALERMEKALLFDYHKHMLFAHRIKLLLAEVQKGIYFYKDADPFLLDFERVNWERIYADLTTGYDFSSKEDQMVIKVITEELQFERDVESNEREAAFKKAMKKMLSERNGLPCMPMNKWHKEPFAPREYEKIDSYVITSSIPEVERTQIDSQLRMQGQGFIGPAYNYDDCGLTEAWMVSFRDRSFKAPSDEEVISTQVECILDILKGQVQDRVCNEWGTLQCEPLNKGDKIREVPVWGIDTSTRRMIELAVEDLAVVLQRPLVTADEISWFIEKQLLPAINAQTQECAHDMSVAVAYIQTQSSCGETSELLCRAILRGIERFGGEHYRIHPKGTGVVCATPEGLPAHVFVTEYLGEIYPPYRWCEKLDVIEQAQKKYKLKPTLPDFYNILLERPRRDPAGYGLLFVDASERANLGSTCSHSCDPNCTSNVVVREGRLVIALTSTRPIGFGEELCMDYHSVTSSEVEWRAAVCLCGMTRCRGHFLHFSTQDELQQVLRQNCGPLWRYASLLRSCSPLPMSAEDEATLDRHGIRSMALGEAPKVWMKKYAADNLRFIEFERTALPCALLRDNSSVTFLQADEDARAVMEQRTQSLVTACSLVSRVQGELQLQDADVPLRHLTAAESISRVWLYMATIPAALTSHLLESTSKASLSMSSEDKTRVSTVITDVSAILDAPPAGPNSLKAAILKIRSEVLKIVDLATSTARLQLLADILLLWASTTNYSVAVKHATLESEPVAVVARELSSLVSRSLITQDTPPPSVRGLSSSSHEKASSLIHKEPSPDASEASRIIKENQHNGSELVPPTTEKATTTPLDPYFKPNEVVYLGSKHYGEYFIFWQLMSWFNAGSDKQEEPPDLFGCVVLPEPASCFGRSEADYNADRRKLLTAQLSDEKKQMHSWPQPLKDCFSSEFLKKYSSHEVDHLFGSPMLDVALGLVDAVHRVRAELLGGKADKSWKDADNTQFDNILPPEMPTAWVQCEDCKKWRRVPWNIDANSLPDVWVCSMNNWDPENANCTTPQDHYDPDRENTLNYEAKGGYNKEEFKINSWRDVFCIKNRVYYEAQVKQIKVSRKYYKRSILFHFKGWGPKFNEWIDDDSDRIQPHNMYTTPSSGTGRDSTSNQPAEEEEGESLNRGQKGGKKWKKVSQGNARKKNKSSSA